MMARPTFSVCVLTYGDHPELITRCLGSIIDRLDETNAALIQDLRIGLNAASERSIAVVMDLAERLAKRLGIVTWLWQSDHNVCKYPMMRRMFFDLTVPPAEQLMWFDDDTFLNGPPGWWNRVASVCRGADLVGAVHYVCPVRGMAYRWVRRQPWSDDTLLAATGSRRFGDRPFFRFPHGWWWVLRRDLAWRFDYPFAELRHCGGDVMLGELARHRQFRQRLFIEGVVMNADARGSAQRSARRGVDEPLLGEQFDPGYPPDHSHQEFGVTRRRIDGSSGG